MTGPSLSAARQIVDVAMATARSRSLAPLAVAVLDAGGHPVVVAREDGAGFLRTDIAIGKAWGALGMSIGTRSLAGKSPEFLAALGAMSEGKVVPSPGGVLILDDGSIIGAVGVSGDTGQNDEVCAVAGIEAAGFGADPG